VHGASTFFLCQRGPPAMSAYIPVPASEAEWTIIAFLDALDEAAAGILGSCWTKEVCYIRERNAAACPPCSRRGLHSGRSGLYCG
jgi:hypothetical protein